MVRKGSVRQENHPIALDRRRDPQVRRRISGPAIRTFFNIADAWDLSVDEQRALLGWPAASTYHKYKAGDVGTLSFDSLTRLSLLIGIYKALHILYPERGLADRWVKLPNSNPLFGGRPALGLMTEGGSTGCIRSGGCLMVDVEGGIEAADHAARPGRHPPLDPQPLSARGHP